MLYLYCCSYDKSKYSVFNTIISNGNLRSNKRAVPLACRTRWLNGAVFWMRPQNRSPMSRYGSLLAQRPWEPSNLQSFTGNWWRFHSNVIFTSGTVNNIYPCNQRNIAPTCIDHALTCKQIEPWGLVLHWHIVFLSKLSMHISCLPLQKGRGGGINQCSNKHLWLKLGWLLVI